MKYLIAIMLCTGCCVKDPDCTCYLQPVCVNYVSTHKHSFSQFIYIRHTCGHCRELELK